MLLAPVFFSTAAFVSTTALKRVKFQAGTTALQTMLRMPPDVGSG
jgi:hypothetical protein